MTGMDNPFWETLEDRGDALAVDVPRANLSWTYRALARQVEMMAEIAAASPRGVAFLFGENDFGSLVGYLSCLRAGHAVYLISAKIQHPWVNILLDRYRPELILTRVPPSEPTLAGRYSPAAWSGEYQRYVRNDCSDPPPHPDLPPVPGRHRGLWSFGLHF